MRSLRRPRGFSLFSALMLLILLGMTVVVAARVVPLTLEYQGIVTTMNNVATAGAAAPAEVRRLLERGFSVNDVTTLKPEDVDIERTAEGMRLTADYDAVAHLVGNVGLVLHFHKEVLIAGAPQL